MVNYFGVKLLKLMELNLGINDNIRKEDREFWKFFYLSNGILILN